jgi:hypothetical protein
MWQQVCGTNLSGSAAFIYYDEREPVLINPGHGEDEEDKWAFTRPAAIIATPEGQKTTYSMGGFVSGTLFVYFEIPVNLALESTNERRLAGKEIFGHLHQEVMELSQTLDEALFIRDIDTSSGMFINDDNEIEAGEFPVYYMMQWAVPYGLQ